LLFHTSFLLPSLPNPAINQILLSNITAENRFVGWKSLGTVVHGATVAGRLRRWGLSARAGYRRGAAAQPIPKPTER
jgi:hypothetical protein